ncbi:MAG TPA: hypothetical protein VKZ53_29305 [Candidatus Angelobacter sp.]|nr:hypothetical protein [Candidatus Angelobacter sp.]
MGRFVTASVLCFSLLCCGLSSAKDHARWLDSSKHHVRDRDYNRDNRPRHYKHKKHHHGSIS